MLGDVMSSGWTERQAAKWVAVGRGRAMTGGGASGNREGEVAPLL
jgi:hypothetical protein